jgi:histone deacetylase 3
MQEIPPDLMGFLANEERSQSEREEDVLGNGEAGERRFDGKLKDGEWMDAEEGGIGDGGTHRKRSRVI